MLANNLPAGRQAGPKKTFTVANLYTEAVKMVKREMSSLKNKPLDAEETEKAEALAKFISKTVLKEMKVV